MHTRRQRGEHFVGLYPLDQYNKTRLMQVLPGLALCNEQLNQNVVYCGDDVVGIVTFELREGSMNVLTLRTIDPDGGYDLVVIDQLIAIAAAMPGISHITISGDRDGVHIDKYVEYLNSLPGGVFCNVLA